MVLKILSRRPGLHGYAIMTDVEEISGVPLGPGTLYGALARLERRGLIEALEPRQLCAADVTSGLNAVYFNNRDFTGGTQSRIDAMVAFDWPDHCKRLFPSEEATAEGVPA